MAAKQPSRQRHLSNISCYLTYSHQDGANYARALIDILASHGMTIVEAGDNSMHFRRWRLSIFRELTLKTTAVIVVVTPTSLRSDRLLAELEFFLRRRDFPLIPIMFRSSLSLHMPDFLLDRSWLPEDESALHDGPSNRVVEELLFTLRRLQKLTPSISTPQPPPPQRRTKRSLNEGKLILVGRGEVGKTSLVRRLVDNKFRGDESKTQGINITMWPLRCRSNTIRLNIWDFGGQEIMHATHQFFLTERSLYLLVLNGREGGEDLDAEYWLKHIETFGGDSPVIIVQNKVAQHPFELNYRGLQARYPQIRGFVKTDCKEAIGLEDLRKMIRQVVEKMPEVRMQFPADWFTVKTRLEAADDNFMSYERFCQLCSQEGIEDETDRDTLCWVLHCLGIALNYRDDSRLRETSVLKPEWVTHGIYKILNAKKLAQRQGELHLQDLQQLLPKKQYPRDKHLFLLELMRKFSLCFAFPDEVDRYLIPELLGKEEPEEPRAFLPSDCLNFEYHYGVLPEGLIPRFIVRSHILSRGQERWRSGVVLAHEECKALVTAEPAERRIVVRVKGGKADARQRLLAIIRYDLDRINGEFKDRLEVQPKVPLADFPTISVDYKKLVEFEKQGVTEFPEFTGQHVIMVRVNDLLNGVDLDQQREESLATMAQGKAVFFSYSHKDEGLRDEFETHLKLLQRQGIISTWHDRKILPGSEWDREIDRSLERAKIIVLLISADFIASDYCWKHEVKRAIERHESGDAIVIPVLLRSCDWKGAPFGKLQGLPKDMTPITAWKDRDAAWTDVATGIRMIAEQFS